MYKKTNVVLISFKQVSWVFNFYKCLNRSPKMPGNLLKLNFIRLLSNHSRADFEIEENLEKEKSNEECAEMYKSKLLVLAIRIVAVLLLLLLLWLLLLLRPNGESQRLHSGCGIGVQRWRQVLSVDRGVDWGRV